MSVPDNRALAEEQAAEWLFRHDRGFGPDDEAGFEAWLSASSDNAAAWARLASAWDTIGTVDRPLIDAMRADALSARPPRARRLWPAAIAATGALAAAIVGVIGWRTMQPAPAPGGRIEIAATASPTYVAGDAVRSVTLADGSRVTLDRGTALAVRFSAGARDLRLLKGEAVFDVRHDGRPFSVDADDVTVTATGTRFDVALEPDEVHATLERGSVTVARKGDTTVVRLRPGQRLVSINGRAMSVTRIDSTLELAWSTGFFEFHDTPLAEAVALVVRGTDVRIRVIGPAGRLKVNGRFRYGDPRGFVAAITQVLQLRQRKAPDGVIELMAR